MQTFTETLNRQNAECHDNHFITHMGTTATNFMKQ